MSLSDAIASLGAKQFTLTHRVNGGIDLHGRAVAPTESTSTTTGMVQPLSGREIDRLPEGLHARELKGYWTRDNLSVADSDAGTMGDHITDTNGTVWEIVGVQDWQDLGGYVRYIISRVDA